MSKNEKETILHSLGGENGCKRLAQAFYSRVQSNADLKTLFPGKSLRCATEEFSAFLVQFLGGDPNHTQYRWWLSLRESHKRFQVSERQRMAWLSVMHDALDSQIEDAQTRNSLEQFFHNSSCYVVGGTKSELENPELSQRWCLQRRLDELVACIVDGRDAEAIDLSREHASRRSVFVGISARMVETGRIPLIDYVLESIRSDPTLGNSRFNGRTLLHFAAGTACVPVVQLLLTQGVDPNVLDAGKHTPLYRAATSRSSDDVATTIDELVRAGAALNHSGGVSKSTALHQAARFGNATAARTLIDLGASVNAADAKGLTPLNRAINCRQGSVAEILAQHANRSL